MRRLLDFRTTSNLQPSVSFTPPPSEFGRRSAMLDSFVQWPTSVSAVVSGSPLISHQWTPSRRSHVITATIWLGGGVGGEDGILKCKITLAQSVDW